MCPSTGRWCRWRSPVRCLSTRKERAAMADTLERTSPLQPWAAQFARLPNSVAIVEEPFVTMVDLRVDPSGPGGLAAAELLGVELPIAASTYAKNSDTTVMAGSRRVAGDRHRAGRARVGSTAPRGGRPARRRRDRRVRAAHHAQVRRPP